MRGRLAAPVVVLAACRFGGPSANPYDYTAFADATADARVAVMSGDDDGSTPPAIPDADDASDDGGDEGGNDGGGVPTLGEASCAPAVAVCDPVHNTGCNPLQQCDVNPLLTTVLTGQCVFAGADAAVCTASIFSESCAPQSTCVDGGCRPLCFCDTDCPSGQCCSDLSGPAGFTLCRPCP